MKNPKIRFIALILVNLLTLYIFKLWINSSPNSLADLIIATAL